MKKLLTKLSFFIITTLSPLAVSAASTDLLGQVGGELTSGKADFKVLLINVINTLFGLLGTIALLIFLYSGFQWMMSGDSKDGTTKAKERMKNAAIGIFIILISYSLAKFVFDTIEKVTT